jgi:hypothetical protein
MVCDSFSQVLKLELAVYLSHFKMTEREQEGKITFQVEQIFHFRNSVVHRKEARW